MDEATATKDVATRKSTELESGQRQAEAPLRPPADIYEDGAGITLQLDMPGVSEDRLSIQADPDTLVVEGSAQIEMSEDMEALYADVRSTDYRHSFAMSRDPDTDKIDATFKDGVVTVKIPKREELRPRKIEIDTA
ncbi:MAG: Hsp20/alpha crystallin family protein [Gammaproteobacteria bacterium]